MDHALYPRLYAGEADAIAQVYLHYRPMLLRLAAQAGHADPEEAARAAFAQVCAAPPADAAAFAHALRAQLATPDACLEQMLLQVTDLPAAQEAPPVQEMPLPPVMPDLVYEAPLFEQFPDLFDTPAPQAAAQPSRAQEDPAAPQAEEDEEDLPPQQHRGIYLTLAALLGLAALYIGAGLLMRYDLLPALDLGYSWFNEHIYPLF